MPKQIAVPANKSGKPFGGFFFTGNGRGFPARVAGASNAQRTFCEVYGYAQEMGDVYTAELVACTREQFLQAAKDHQHADPTKTYCDKLKKWDVEQGTWL